MKNPELGSTVIVNVSEDLYGGPMDNTIPYVVIAIQFEELLAVEREDKCYYFGDNYWIVEREHAQVAG